MKGRAEPSSTVSVRIGIKEYKTIVTPGGSFQISIPLQKAGTVLSFYSIDSFQNKSEVTKIVIKDVTAPVTPKIYAITSKSKLLTGKTESYAYVTIKYSKYTVNVRADKNGIFKIKLKPMKKGTLFTISAKDKAGNISKKTTIKISK